MLERLLQSFDNCEHLKECESVAIAVSGGIDSLALSISFNEWAKINNKKFICITVDHKLRKKAKDEAEYINELLTKKFNIEHYILNWEGEKPTKNIEEKAREARYNLIFNLCREKNIDTILLAHHIQDQAENFLIRLFRGSGLKGLSSMKKFLKMDDMFIVRPFLNLEKEDLEKYLLENNIQWIEDESNFDDKYLRNKIRFFLNSFEDKKDIVERINNSVNILQVADGIIEEHLKEITGNILTYDEEYNFFTIDFKKFNQLDIDLKYRVLNTIFSKLYKDKKTPRFSKFETFLKNITNFQNFKKYTFNFCVFEKINNNQFVCYKEYNSIKNSYNHLKKGDFKKYLKFLKENDLEKYKKIKNFTGYKKEILYTIKVLEYK